MDCCKGSADKELEDLKGGESTFDAARDAVAETGNSVVGVLSKMISKRACYWTQDIHTIIVWMPELTRANIQIGGLIYRIPAHMQSIAPAWW